MNSNVAARRNNLSIFTASDDTDWDLHFGLSSNKKPPSQLLKWVGNKQRFAQYIASIFPDDYGTYIEPFLGSGAVLGAIKPRSGIAGRMS